MSDRRDILPISQAAGQASRFGARAARLGVLSKLGLPVPPGQVIAFDMVRRLDGVPQGLAEAEGLVSLRASPEVPGGGSVSAILNIGMTQARLPSLEVRLGRIGALEIYRRFIQTYGTRVAGLDGEDFENLYYDQLKLSNTPTEHGMEALVDDSLAFYQDEVGEAFPQDARAQLSECLRAMCKDWTAPTAKILRTARGLPEDANLGLIVQDMVFGLGPDSGAGLVQFTDEATGEARATGRYLPNAQGQDASTGVRTPHLATVVEREGAGQTLPSLEEIAPDTLAGLRKAAEMAAGGLRDAQRLGFTVSRGTLYLLDAVPARRSARAAVQIAVDLAQAGHITQAQAILRVEPSYLNESLHPQIGPYATRDVIGTGLAASPGAAVGRIVFSSQAAHAAQAAGEMAILVRAETSPEDIRGMHSAVAVLTVRGGMTSHAAVIARGLGLPCVVGASDLRLDVKAKTLTAVDGRVLGEGDQITIDGTSGQALMGAPTMVPPKMTEAFDTLMTWADATRTIGVRANADTTQDAEVALRFKVDGIGLVRTEHMFFEGDRIAPMREMILAEDDAARAEALERLLPMQRSDFTELFRTMGGLPVTIRLLDPPLHEFLPHSEEDLAAVAEATGRSTQEVLARAQDLAEFNPMLGKRGVRVGLTTPEIYDMQARAIFEAVAALAKEGLPTVTPEIMIPLVSAQGEVTAVKDRVDAIADEIRAAQGVQFAYEIGVMIETPRGALRAGDLAQDCAFFSFGTNDLTQMVYGLSRDDAGRFMRDYVNSGIFEEDPFHSLDVEGVGELVLMAAKRARAARPDIVLGLCGEHGGDPASIRFCRVAGFDYVSCSPFRVPVARLAAAQASLLVKQQS
ncbi:MAG: pyruvate, phosphate dikinase [Pseudomonadota bacterium]